MEILREYAVKCLKSKLWYVLSLALLGYWLWGQYQNVVGISSQWFTCTTITVLNNGRLVKIKLPIYPIDDRVSNPGAIQVMTLSKNEVRLILIPTTQYHVTETLNDNFLWRYITFNQPTYPVATFTIFIKARLTNQQFQEVRSLRIHNRQLNQVVLEKLRELDIDSSARAMMLLYYWHIPLHIREAGVRDRHIKIWQTNPLSVDIVINPNISY